MSMQVNSGIRREAREFSGDVAEIQSIGRPRSLELVSAANLHFAEAAKSLNQTGGGSSGLLEPLTTFLGESLTSANSAWTGNPVPRMRALQKVLVGHGIGLPDGERDSALQAITVIEKSIQLRLRLQQLRMIDHEIAQAPSSAPKP